jgi:thiosulfate/3-mercaptopyruvate sulfurtransferase
VLLLKRHNTHDEKTVKSASTKANTMKTKLLIAFLLVSGFARAQAPILVSPQWLNEHKNDPNLVILQVSFLQVAYEREHIAGARFLWPTWLAPNSPQTSYNAPDPKEAEKVLQELGISNNSHVVIYHVINEVSPTARMFLTLEHLGLYGQVSFLNGGLDAWKKAGLPVTKDLPPPAVKGKFKVKPGRTLLVDKEYVLKTLQNPSSVVVDARAKNIYDGDPVGYPRNGHITGAKNIYFNNMLDQTTNMFKPVDSLQNYFAPVVPDKKSEVVAYCFIGQTASVLYLTGRILGYNVKIYDGSMQEWSWIDELPIETTKK